MSEITDNAKETTTTNDVEKNDEQEGNAANIKESKDSDADVTTKDTDTDADSVQAQSEQCLSVKPINSSVTTVDINTLTPSTPSQTPPQLLAAETSATTTTATAASSGGTSATAIPENILSPPKSETQTDETNTATSTSCSPASEGQRSPIAEPDLQPQDDKPAPKEEELDKATTVNGTIPKSGKPLVTALNKKLNKSATTSPRASRARKLKALPMYESEISDHKVGIKLCIKKSEAAAGGAEMPATGAIATPVAPSPRSASSAAKPARKRVRKPKQQDSDESEYEPRKKKGGSGGSSNNSERQKRISNAAAAEADAEPIEQSAWGHGLPEEVLFHVRQ